MLMQVVEPGTDWHAHVAVRLLRRWAALGLSDRPQLPGLVELAAQLGLDPAVAVAYGSVFQLTEACLGRPLAAQCCCSRDLGADECAMLHMLRATPARASDSASAAIPHGLPSALVWALLSAKRLSSPVEALFPDPPARCPFD